MKTFLVLVCCLGLATVANAGVVALYEFEGGLTDTSGSATTYDGTAIGSPELIVDGERGNVLSVSPGNQVDGGVVTPSSVTDLTVGLWVMTTQSVGASQCPLTSSSDCYQTVGGWQLMMREGPWPGPNNFWAGINGAPEVDPAWDGGYLFIHKDPDPVFTYGEWVHVVFTFDATSRMMKGYVNGLFCSSMSSEWHWLCHSSIRDCTQRRYWRFHGGRLEQGRYYQPSPSPTRYLSCAVR